MIDDGPWWHMSDPINDDGNDGVDDVLIHVDIVDDDENDDDDDDDVDAMYDVLSNDIHLSLTTFE